MQRQVPYGVSDFRKVAMGDYYFVDKTRYIRELEKFVTPVFLRSRRFGKSLWCSILECYYDINYAGEFEALFGKTEIGRNPTPAHNSRLVVRLDFSTVEVSADYQTLKDNFNRTVGRQIDSAIAAHPCLAQAPQIVREGSANDRLDGVLAAIRDNGLPHAHIVIDEYDNFTNMLITSRCDDLYTEVTTGDSFLRTFFKTIKSGVGMGTVDHVFITGVLPVTIDDLTSGYNIAQVITFGTPTLHMMGFTQEEVVRYVDEIFEDHPELDPGLKSTVLEDLRTHYDGYQLLPQSAEHVYNSTIANFYLSNLIVERAIPEEKFDPNVNTDVNWIKRLARGSENAKALVDKLLVGEGIPLTRSSLATTFSREKLFDEVLFAVTLYYLGLVTFTSSVTAGIPNLTIRNLFTTYFNDLWDVKRLFVDGNAAVYGDFIKDYDWRRLFEGFEAQYLRLLPAQAYDKANENFFRSAFYLVFHSLLQMDYEIRIEDGLRTGRTDLTAVGRPTGGDPKSAVVVEFKYYSGADIKRKFAKAKKLKNGMPQLARAPRDAVAQLNRYADELMAKHPGKTLRKYVVVYFSTKGYRLFQVRSRA